MQMNQSTSSTSSTPSVTTQATAVNLTPEHSIQIDPASEAHLKWCFQNPRDSNSKLVVAKIEDDSGFTAIILGLCHRHIAHPQALQDASLAILQKEAVTSIFPSTSKPLPGVVVEGAYFLLHDGRVAIHGQSGTFGPLANGIFDEPTKDVVSRFLKAKLDEYSRLTQRNHSATLGDLSRPASPSQ